MLRRKAIPLAAVLWLAGMCRAGGAPNKLAAVDAAGLRNLVAAHKGRAVLVSFWATWCVPCKQEFPSLVKLQNAYRSKGLDVIAVTIDDPPKEAEARAFLAQQKASMTSVIKKPGSPAALMKSVDPAWQGAVPLTAVYNRAGKLSGLLRGSHTYGELEAAVDKALK